MPRQRYKELRPARQRCHVASDICIAFHAYFLLILPRRSPSPSCFCVAFAIVDGDGVLRHELGADTREASGTPSFFSRRRTRLPTTLPRDLLIMPGSATPLYLFCAASYAADHTPLRR